MKKTILVAMFLGGIFAANAQTTPGTLIGKATLNVNLYPIQDITVNPGNSDVDLNYKTKDDYREGVDVDKKDHLVVYSTGAFTVTVNSSKANLTNTINNEKISASDIYITSSRGSTATALNGVSYSTVQLSTNPVTLIESDKGGFNKTFNVNYDARNVADAYVNKYYNEQNPTVYSTDIIYTIVAG